MKISLFILLTTCCYLPSATAQDSLLQKMVSQNWFFNQTVPGETSQYIYKSYHFIFEEEGYGYLNVSLIFKTDGEADIGFGGMVKFTYEVMEPNTASENELLLRVTFLDFSFLNAADYDRGATRKLPDFDKNLLDDITRSFSNTKEDYRIQFNQNFLVIEGFSQNQESVFTYFEANPIRRGDY